jgi:hypothetical protein
MQYRQQGFQIPFMLGPEQSFYDFLKHGLTIPLYNAGWQAFPEGSSGPLKVLQRRIAVHQFRDGVNQGAGLTHPEFRETLADQGVQIFFRFFKGNIRFQGHFTGSQYALVLLGNPEDDPLYVFLFPDDTGFPVAYIPPRGTGTGLKMGLIIDSVPEIGLPDLPGEGKKIEDTTNPAKAAGKHPEKAGGDLPQVKTVKAQDSETG